ncbi:MAG: putative dehydrogenase [Actinomycetia bacterium]|nr:putative dehydrogenase [Actinomycetes bacterium]
MTQRFHVGDSWERVVADGLTRTQIVMYAGASGDFHPVHHDEVVAAEMGYPSIFAHGMLTMGLTGRLLTDVVGDEGLVRYGARMVSQVWPGDVLTATLTVESVRDGEVELSVRTVNQDGVVVLAGSATAGSH